MEKIYIGKRVGVSLCAVIDVEAATQDGQQWLLEYE